MERKLWLQLRKIKIENYIGENPENLIKFLKFMGNNYKYSYENQACMFSKNPDGKYYANDIVWRKYFRRGVIEGEKPTYLLEEVNGSDEVYDINQTVLLESERDIFKEKVWVFFDEKYSEYSYAKNDLLAKMAGISENRFGRYFENVYMICSNKIDAEWESGKGLSNAFFIWEQKLDLEYLKWCVTIGVCENLNCSADGYYPEYIFEKSRLKSPKEKDRSIFFDLPRISDYIREIIAEIREADKDLIGKIEKGEVLKNKERGKESELLDSVVQSNVEEHDEGNKGIVLGGLSRKRSNYRSVKKLKNFRRGAGKDRRINSIKDRGEKSKDRGVWEDKAVLLDEKQRDDGRTNQDVQRRKLDRTSDDGRNGSTGGKDEANTVTTGGIGSGQALGDGKSETLQGRNEENRGDSQRASDRDDYKIVSESNSLKEPEKWIVEFNETNTFSLKNYAGMVLTRELLDEMVHLDNDLYLYNKIYENDIDKWQGYLKFYFENTGVLPNLTNRIRIDVGDGLEANKDLWLELYELIGTENTNDFESLQYGFKPETQPLIEEDMVAVKVGFVFTIVPNKMTENISLIKSTYKVNFEGKEYELHTGEEYVDSELIDRLIDEYGYPEYKISDYMVDNLSENTTYEISTARPKFVIGDKVIYNNEECIITKFDYLGGAMKTVTVTHSIDYLGEKLSKDDVIPYHMDSDLDGLFTLVIEEEEEISKTALTDEKERFSLEIDKALNNSLNRYESILVLSKTPKILQEIGLKDLPILFSQGHLRDCLHERGENQRWHGLKKEDLIELVELLQKPAFVLDSFTDNKTVIIVTNRVDDENNPIIASIKTNGQGNYQLEHLDSNYLTSVYGKKNIETFIERAEKEDKLLYYDKKIIQEAECFANLQLIGNSPVLESNHIIHQSRNIGNGLNKNKVELSTFSPVNYKITEEVLPDALTPSERLKLNIEAIKTLRQLENGEIGLDLKSQNVLAKYIGWGGLADVFDETKEGQWMAAREFLKENLSEDEYLKAKESTLTAFYTPKVVIDGIYKVLSDMGFSKGNILEPSMAIGNFFGSVPEKLSESKFFGVELDTVSGKIAQYLYPEAKIKISGYEETDFSDNFFDVAIGNVPFGDFKVFDSSFKNNGFLIHDYFFAKTLEKVKAGGVIAFITSSGTMDKKDTTVREYISKRAEFLGAIRLPNTTFKGVAGTEVTSDIIFLKKRESANETTDSTFLNLATDDKGLTYNEYFVKNPQMILGEMVEVSGQFGMKLTCNPIEDVPYNSETLKKYLEIAGNNISENHKYTIDNTLEEEVTTEYLDLSGIKNFSYFIKEGRAIYKENSDYIDIVPNSEQEKVKEYIELRNNLLYVIKLQNEMAEDFKLSLAQEKLNESYNKFVEKYDIINKRKNEKVLREDSSFPLVSALEVMEGDKFIGKADIFSKRTINISVIPERVDSAVDGLILSKNTKGFVDINYISQLTDSEPEKVRLQLKGKIFIDIKGLANEYNLLDSGDFINMPYVTEDEYLSGNIREKISYIDMHLYRYSHPDEYLGGSDGMKVLPEVIEILNFQKEKLNEVLPEMIKAENISVRLGTTWIPTKYYEEFMFEILNTPSYYKNNIKVRFSEFTGEFNISAKSLDGGLDATDTYGTNRVNAYYILQNALNLKSTQVFDKVIDEDGREIQVLNETETLLAQNKQEILSEEFKDWIFTNFDRRENIEEIYNEKFNSVKNREYDGSNLRFDGISSDISLKEHQVNAIARVLFGGNTLLAHTVGAGKTFEMIASAMESKRLGMSNKALFVVPNHLTEQIGKDFLRLYPSANILVALREDFKPKNRKRFVGKIATGDYDGIIIGHSQFEKIPMSVSYQVEHIQNQIQEITSEVERLKEENGERFTIKQLEKLRKNLEAKYKNLLDDSDKDDVIYFDELGVDRLYVDEAHNYKNLFYYTKMRNVAGLSQTEAKKSSDMYMKCRYMDEITGGKGVIFATGTPVSNSMAELYTMQRYLQYGVLQKMGLEHFDSWASTFGETVTAFELNPEGTGYRQKTRFSKFYNLPELMATFKEVADIKTAKMLDLPTPDVTYKTIVTHISEEQKKILSEISERADKVRNREVDPREDNMLKITTDGKKLAIDQRLIDPELPDDPNSKVNHCVENVYRIWEETKSDRLAQLIFSDMSTPKKDGSFNIYDDMKNKLIELGVPDKEIEFIHNANTEKEKELLFSKVREGKVRILMGSTSKMGAGTNVQDKLIASHDLDVPWRPADLEQRAGRIVRRGNENVEVEVYRYITENTFDSYLWQIIEGKQRYIDQVMSDDLNGREIEDGDSLSLSYAEIKAEATGNPIFKEKMELDNEQRKLTMLKRKFLSNKYALEEKIEKFYPKVIEDSKQKLVTLNEEIPLVSEIKTCNIGEEWKEIKLYNCLGGSYKGVIYKTYEEAQEHYATLISDSRKLYAEHFAEYRGITLGISKQYDSEYGFKNVIHLYLNNKRYDVKMGNGLKNTLKNIDKYFNEMPERKARTEEKLIQAERDFKEAQIKVTESFMYEERLNTVCDRLKEIDYFIIAERTKPKEEAVVAEKDYGFEL